MLSIGKLSAGMEQYYERSVAKGADDYYSGAGESAGEWRGRGALALGLTGQVRDGQLTALMAGLNPETGAQLRERTGSDRVGALDLTFSAPKSISVLFAAADERTSAAVVACHEDAVRAALSYVEDTAAIVRRGKGGHEWLPAGGLIVGSFRHRMSRARDPQLHTHNVVANWAQGPDGRYTSLFGQEIYRAAKTAGYVYQAHLRALVTERLGLEWGPVRKGAGELAAIDAPVLTEFSRRKAEILEAAERGHIAVGGPAAANYAVRVTREAKQQVATADWRADVRARAAEHGLDLGRVSVAEGDRRGLDGLTFDHLAGPEGLTRLTNTFGERDVVQEVAQAAGDGATVAEVRAAARAFVERADVLEVAGGRFTTQDLLDAERARESAQLGRLDERCSIVRDKALRDGIRDAGLNGGQESVIRSVFTSGRGVEIVEAAAGTGKTFTASAIRRVAELDERPIIGTAPTGRARDELQAQAGITSHTLDSLLGKLDRGDIELTRRTVIVFDEAGMAGTRLAARLEQHAEAAGCKVIEIRDSRQLQSVLAGGTLQDAHERLGGLELTEVVRQRDPAERRALGRLRAGHVEGYLEHVERDGRVHYGAELDQAVDRYLANVREVGFNNAALIVPTNAMARQANDAARERLAGELGAERNGFRIGDRVVFLRNDGFGDGRVSNGDRGTVTGNSRQALEVERDDGGKRYVQPGYIAAGDLALGYATTIHKAQGATVDRCVIAARPSEMYSELSYVAASRARDSTDLYLIDSPRDDERAEIGPVSLEVERDQRAELIRAMSESRAEDLAMEQLPARDLGFGLER